MPINTVIDPSAVARVVGIEPKYKDYSAGAVRYLPQRIALLAQGSTGSVYSTTKAEITSAFEAGAAYGFGSPIHLMMLQLRPSNGDGVGTIPVTVYPLVDDGSGVAATGDITPVGTATKAGQFRIGINNVFSNYFAVAVGDTVADFTAAATTAINEVLEIPMIAVDGTTAVNLTSKWKGSSANSLLIEVDGPTDTGITIGLTQPSGGLINPDVDTALAQIGNVWETLILNQMEIADTTTLDKIQTVGDGRWGALQRKPFVSIVGDTAVTVASASAVPDARKLDKINFVVNVPGSKSLPFVIAARAAARIAKQANNNPARDYARLQLTGIAPGADSEQWDYPNRDSAVKKGVSTTESVDGVVNLSDTITFYHPSGDPLPAYRYVVKIIKLMQVIYNVSLSIDTPEWDGAPLIPDSEVSTNPTAKRPRDLKAALAAVIDSLADDAIISDREFSKSGIIAEIDSQNPDRINLNIPVKISGNNNISSVELQWGFFFGGSA